MSPLTESIFPKKLSSFSGRTALESTIPWELENIIDLTIDELIQLEEEKIDFDFTLKSKKSP